MKKGFFSKTRNRIIVLVVLIIVTGFILPQNLIMPVEGATSRSYHPNSFWAYPWGTSITHKGVDIFARKGVAVRSSTAGIVLFAGQNKKGGNAVMVLGPKWRVHYYAHLDEIKTSRFSWASQNETIGTVGTSGNAQGKPPHLHYSIYTLIPYLWRADGSKQGWKKMFFLNPISYLRES